MPNTTTFSTCGDGQCDDDFYGTLCNVPNDACGTIWNTTFGPDMNYKDVATLADPKCQCDTPELMSGLTYIQGSKNPYSKNKMARSTAHEESCGSKLPDPNPRMG